MRVIGIAGWSGAGKTTLIERMIPVWRARGLTVATIKHAHHGFDLDTPGKDSWRHREAGASKVLMLSDARWVLLAELRGEPAPTFAEQLALLAPCDLVVVEGFKRAPVPKIEVYRPEVGKPPIWPNEPMVAAVAVPGGEGVRAHLPTPLSLPLLDLDSPQAVAEAAMTLAAPAELFLSEERR
jgi:molybdopterin-guanine dinucleotide biosynthesis protein B